MEFFDITETTTDMSNIDLNSHHQDLIYSGVEVVQPPLKPPLHIAGVKIAQDHHPI